MEECRLKRKEAAIGVGALGKLFFGNREVKQVSQKDNINVLVYIQCDCKLQK